MFNTGVFNHLTRPLTVAYTQFSQQKLKDFCVVISVSLSGIYSNYTVVYTGHQP